MRDRVVLSLWLPRLAVEASLRRAPVSGPFALTQRLGNADRLAGVSAAAAAQGLRRGMMLADARARVPGLVTWPADPEAEARALTALLRWAGRFSPWVGRDADGLVLDLTGGAHLFGGEAALAAAMGQRLAQGGLTARIGLAPSRGAAHALARHVARADRPAIVLDPAALPAILGPLPVKALRLEEATADSLARVGLRRIAELEALPRAPLARRYGQGLTLRLDQAFARVPEPVRPEAAPQPVAARLTLAEPIGLLRDLAAGLDLLLRRVCAQLEARGEGATALAYAARRVDGAPPQVVHLRLARPMRDPATLARLMAPRLETIESGFGIDALRLVATATEALAPQQQTTGGDPAARRAADAFADLVTRLGNRLGFDAVTRMEAAESHLPERSYRIVEARIAPDPNRPRWAFAAPRPLRVFPPEPVLAPDAPLQPTGRQVPASFRWRRMTFTTASASGPERIAPEWWFDHPAWRSGPRDYWRVVTQEGRMLWLYRALKVEGWWVEGDFG